MYPQNLFFWQCVYCHLMTSSKTKQAKCISITYLSIKLLVPSKTDPIGAPRDLLRQKHTLSMSLTILFGATLIATAAFIILAPSIWTGILWDFAIVVNLSNHSTGKTWNKTIGLNTRVKYEISWFCPK